MSVWPGWTAGVFGFLERVLMRFLNEVYRWGLVTWAFVVGAVMAIVVPVLDFLEWLVALTAWLAAETSRIGTIFDALGSSNAGQYWAALSHGAAVANCVVPLDYAIANASLLLTAFAVMSAIKSVIFAVRIIRGAG